MKKKIWSVLLTLVLLLTLMPIQNAKAAELKLSATKKTVTEGERFVLKVKNNTKKKQVKWSSSKKSVARVSQKGSVLAVKAGTATIKAKVGTTTLKCKVTVKAVETEGGIKITDNIYLMNSVHELKVEEIAKNTYRLTYPEDITSPLGGPASFTVKIIKSDLDANKYVKNNADKIAKETEEAFINAGGDKGSIEYSNITEFPTENVNIPGYYVADDMDDLSIRSGFYSSNGYIINLVSCSYELDYFSMIPMTLLPNIVVK